MVAARQPEREDYLSEVMATLSAKLDEFGIKAEVRGRPKHLWSIYEKMVIGGKEFDDISTSWVFASSSTRTATVGP